LNIRKVLMGKVRWSSAFGFGQGFKIHSAFPRAHFKPFAPSTRLDHEVVSDSLVTTFASDPSVLCLEPGFHLGKKPRVTSHQFKVDYAFNTDDSNDTVYDAVARPCIDLALRVRDRILGIPYTGLLVFVAHVPILM